MKLIISQRREISERNLKFDGDRLTSTNRSGSKTPRKKSIEVTCSKKFQSNLKFDNYQSIKVNQLCYNTPK